MATAPDSHRTALRAVGGAYRARLGGALTSLLPVVGLLSALCVWTGSASAAPIPGQYIVVLKDSVTNPGAVASQHARDDRAQVSHVYSHALKGYAARIPAAALGRLQSDP